jgi:hypothetical protein
MRQVFVEGGRPFARHVDLRRGAAWASSIEAAMHGTAFTGRGNAHQ